MNHPLILCALSLVLHSCSVVESEPALRERWSVSDEIPDATDGSRRGAVDEDHFYTVRGRSAAGPRLLTAFSRSDGSTAWTGNVEQGCQRIFAAAGRVFCPGRALYAFEAESGRPLWTLPVDSSLSLVEGIADASRVFAGSLSSVYAADAVTGTLLWKRSFSGTGWVGTRMRSLTLTPGGDLLVAFEAEFTPNGARTAAVILAVDPTTGAERWRYQDGDATTFRSIGSLTLWNGLILYSDATGDEVGAESVALDAATRQVRWRVTQGPGFLGSTRAPTVLNGVAYWAGGDTRIYAVDAATGQQQWAVEPARGSYSNHEVCGPVVLASSSSLRVVERATGAFRGTLFSDDVVGQMAVDGDEAFVATERGVYAFACD